jgi:Domain of unknown function (DUF4402)
MAGMKPRLLSALLLLLAAAAVSAAVKIVTVSPTRNLAFGRFVAGAGGSVTVAPSGARTKAGGVVLLSAGTISSAAFSITESGNGKSPTWTISVPAQSPVTLSSGNASMVLNNFVSNPIDGSSGSGPATMTVGATLTVGPNQPPGNYSGSFNVTVNYQ